MILVELLPELKRYPAIIVTGPQRSGTTLGAHILAHELGYTYIDEDSFEIHNPQRAQEYMRMGQVVLQAPGLMYCAEKLGGAVVVMRRPIKDIEASEVKSGWRTAYNGLNLRTEQDKYKQVWSQRGYASLAACKYYTWDMYQEPHCVSFNLNYDSLETHPFWTDEHQTLAIRQWRTANE